MLEALTLMISTNSTALIHCEFHSEGKHKAMAKSCQKIGSIFFSLVVLSREFSEATYTDVTRSTYGDLYTNPKWSDSDTKQACAGGYRHYEACERHNSVSIGGYCFSNEECCRQCQCSMAKPTYLRHERRCVSNDNLTTFLFQDSSKGCTFRLVANDYVADTPRSSNTCEFTDLSLPVLDTQASGSLKVDICGIFTWSVSECSVLTGAYYDNGRWTDTWDAGTDQAVFSLEKKWGNVLFLKWNGSLSSRYNGYVMSLDAVCNRKFGLSSIESCLLFKTNGTQMETRPSTPPPTNSSCHDSSCHDPAHDKKTQGKTRDMFIIITVSAVCAFFAVVFISLVIMCYIRQRRLGIKKGNLGKKEIHDSELQDTTQPFTQNARTTSVQGESSHEFPVYQSADDVTSPVYTVPEDTPAYQNLLPNKEKPDYQPLVKGCISKAEADSNSPIYHMPSDPNTEEEPSSTEQELHEYHVLEGP